MNRFCYVCKSAFKSIYCFKCITAIRVISVYICLLIILSFLALYYGTQEFINGSVQFSNINELNLYVAELPGQDINPQFSLYESEFHAIQRRIVFNNTYLGGISVSVISKNYPYLYNDFLSAGRAIEEENECIVGNIVAKKYGMQIGDDIAIGKGHYKVSGFTGVPRFASKILLVDENEVEIGYPRFYFFSDSEYCSMANNEFLFRHNEIRDYFYKFLNDYSGELIILVCVMILIYSLLSIAIIMQLYSERIHMRILIQYYSGVNNAVVFMQSLIENTIISSIATILAYITAILFLDYLMQITMVYAYLPLNSLVEVYLFAIFLSVILSSIDIRMNRRMINRGRK